MGLPWVVVAPIPAAVFFRCCGIDGFRLERSLIWISEEPNYFRIEIDFGMYESVP